MVPVPGHAVSGICAIPLQCAGEHYAGAPERNDAAAMKEAARRSGAAEFIEQLAGGYEQVLGKEFEDGVDLSAANGRRSRLRERFTNRHRC